MTDEDRILFDQILAEYEKTPIEYFRHDVKARNDSAIQQLCIKLGYRGYGMYWTLVELLAERETHYYDMSDPTDKRMLLHGMNAFEDITEKELLEFLETLADLDLIVGEVYHESHKVMIERILQNVAEVVKYKAWRKYGAIKGKSA